MTFLAEAVNNNKNEVLTFRLQKVSDKINNNVLSVFCKDKQRLQQLIKLLSRGLDLMTVMTVLTVTFHGGLQFKSEIISL